MSLDQTQHLLMEALLADDPPATLQRLLAAGDVPAEVRAALGRVDEDGLRLASLLIRKLRFERLTRALPELGTSFIADPASFAAHFADYTAAVPPEGYFPDEEGRLYQRWAEDRGVSDPGHPRR
jgi:hypothetical protein